ncbi:MAG: hypothetical protein ACREVE_15945 [Gammaproteobacteria bacterium]
MDIEFNNIAELDTGGTGWFMGFSDWAKAMLAGVADLRYMPADQRSHALCMKWMAHPAHDPRGVAKPPSQGRTLSILVSETGCFRLEFARDRDFPAQHLRRCTLRRHGDFVIWGEGLHHRWFVDQACTILTLRWIPDGAAGE